MKKFSANYVYPVNSDPVKNGVITVDENGQVVDISQFDDQHPERASMAYYNGVLVPGFINAHCHLELSHLKGKFQQKTGIAGFISQVKDQRTASADEIEISIKRALSTLFTQGVVAVGDICNTTDTIELKYSSKIRFHNFIEIFGLNSDHAKQILIKGFEIKDQFEKTYEGFNTLAPHATYSLSEKLWNLLSHEFINQNGPISIHYGESKEEYEFLEKRSGKLANSFIHDGIRIDLPAIAGPLEIVSNYIPAENKILFVHNTYVSQKETELIFGKFRDPYFVLCPSSNLFIEGVLPDVPMLFNSGVPIALGTDSYASTYTISVFDQIMILLEEFPSLRFEDVLKWGTLNGAKALNFEGELGSFEVGKKPGINLITNFDFRKMRPTSRSQIKKIL